MKRSINYWITNILLSFLGDSGQVNFRSHRANNSGDYSNDDQIIPPDGEVSENNYSVRDS